jgi:predicted dehydrogenase
MHIETDDLAAAWFRHENGVRGQWWVSRVSPPGAPRGLLEVIGPQGALRASLSRGVRDVLEQSTPADPDWRPVDLPGEQPQASPMPSALERMMQEL